MNSRFDNVVILTPSGSITGGPEALHQLSFTINNMGASAKIAYFGGGSECTFTKDAIICTGRSQQSLEAYQKYQPICLDEIKVTDKTLLIAPETHTMAMLNINFPNKALWWLSVDNSIAHNPNLKYESYKKKLFQDSKIIHFYQSEYAKQYLLDSGASPIVPLYDFIDSSFHGSRIDHSKKKFVSIFPRKGGETASQFISKVKINDLSLKLIENMNTGQVIEALKESIIYLDFGHHPGKDRVPREAIASEAIVFVNKQGAAKNFIDYSLDEYFKFDLDEINSGRLEEKIKEVLNNPAIYLEKQSYIKQKIALEQDEFRHQVSSYFLMGK